MNTLQKTKLRGTGVNLVLIVLLFAAVLLLSQTLSDNVYRRVLVPIIWQMCIFILLGTSLNLTLGYLGQLTLGHMGFAGVGAYTAALTSLALERAGLFKASEAAPGQLILVILGCCLLGAIFAALLGLLAARDCRAVRQARPCMPTGWDFPRRCRQNTFGWCCSSPFCALRSCVCSSTPSMAARSRPSATMRSPRRPPA